MGAVPALAIFVWWMADEGGYAPAAWMPGLVAVAALTGLVVAISPDRRGRSRPQMGAIAAFALYTLWSFASILWSDAPGPALEGSQRTLLYLLCFVAFALLPWTARALLALLAVFVTSVTALGLITILRVTGADDPGRFFIEARLIAPLGYHNASAALWTSAAIPALVLASRREVIAWLRPVFLGSAGLLLGLALLTQSRGWLFTLPLVLVAALVAAPGRFRLVAFGGLVAAALAVVAPDLLDVYAIASGAPAAASGRVLAETFDAAAGRLLLAAAGLVAAGAIAVWADARWQRSLTLARRARRRATAWLLVAMAAVAAAGTLVATDGRPIARADRAWAQFQDFDGGQGQGAANRFSTLGSSRYDFWRVAVDAWREHPVAGIGQDNFAQAYTAGRASEFEEPRWVHSLPLRLLTHTGLVGAALFAAFGLFAAWAVVANARAAGRAGRRAAALAAPVAALPACVWALHGSVDWLWEYPALSAGALALLGAATALRPPVTSAAGRRRRPALARLRPALGGVVAVVCAALVIPSYIAGRDVTQAAAGWPADPAAAAARLERARALNPLSARASLVEGLIAVRRGRLGAARVRLQRAADREPRDWYARFELGLVAGARHDRRTALAQLQAARRRNPLDPLIAEAIARQRAGNPMGFRAADEQLTMRVARRLGAS